VRHTEREEWSGQLSLFEDDSARQAPAGRNILVFEQPEVADLIQKMIFPKGNSKG